MQKGYWFLFGIFCIFKMKGLYELMDISLAKLCMADPCLPFVHSKTMKDLP